MIITKTTKTSTGEWLRIFPNDGEDYHLYDAVAEIGVGRILVDADDDSIYDGEALSIPKQEEMACFITGRKEIELLLTLLEKY